MGAALGTTLSQTLSVIVALFGIRRHKTGLRLSRQNFRPRKGVLGRILKIGLPVAVQDGCIQVAFIIITIIANHRGLIDSAAVGIVEKIISAMFIVPSSMLGGGIGVVFPEPWRRQAGARRPDPEIRRHDRHRVTALP